METKQITNSSQVIEIGYDKDSKIFVVTYSNKAKYNYYDVEPNLWDKATSASQQVNLYQHSLNHINLKK